MNYKYLIFDLDGTISNPEQGILRSLNFALNYFGFEEVGEQQVQQYIGPPLDSSFALLTKSSDQQLIKALVSKYRERYAETGFSENILYEEIPETLRELQKSGQFKLGVCTAKRVDFAEQIIDMFNLSELFTFINGGETGIHKWQQLQQLLQAKTIDQNSIMIGDRDFDLIAAHKNQLAAAAVLWGFGPLAELNKQNPEFVFSHPQQLKQLIN